MQIELIEGAEAIAWGAANSAAWSALHKRCSWGTAFLDPGFFRVWFGHYGQIWRPLIVAGRGTGGALEAIMPLARRQGLITGVGAHQAEYQGWVSTHDGAPRFLCDAVALLSKTHREHTLRLRYLGSGTPHGAIDALIAANSRALASTSERQYLETSPTHIDETLKKKGNRSKLNRLNRAGKLELRTLQGNEIDAHLDELIAMYDFRQGAMNDDCPFQFDLRKRAFYRAWLSDAPDQVRAHAMLLDGRLISALVLVMSGREAHLSIAAHAPEHSDNSANKLHIYLCAQALAGEGVDRIDLTPGGDAWKARFATGSDRVHELTVHASVAAAARARTSKAAKRWAATLLERAGMTVPRLKQIVGRLRSKPPEDKGRIETELLLRRLSPGPKLDERPSALIRINALADLVGHGMYTLGAPHRQPFLKTALTRIEGGSRCCSIAMPPGVACMAWRTQTEEGAIELHDFWFADGRDVEADSAALLRALLSEAKADGVVQLVRVDAGLAAGPMGRTLQKFGFALMPRREQAAFASSLEQR